LDRTYEELKLVLDAATYVTSYPFGSYL